MHKWSKKAGGDGVRFKYQLVSCPTLAIRRNERLARRAKHENVRIYLTVKSSLLARTISDIHHLIPRYKPRLNQWLAPVQVKHSLVTLSLPYAANRTVTRIKTSERNN